MTRLRIVHCIGDMGVDTGGPPRSVAALCEAMARAGAEVTLLTQDRARPASMLVLPDPALVTTRLVRAGRRLGIAAPDYGPALATARPDIVHDNGIWSPSNIAATTAAARLGVPTVISLHGMLEPWALNHRAMKKRVAWRAYQHRLLRGAAGLHATAPPERDSIRSRFPHHPVAVIANGVDCPDVIVDAGRRADSAGRTLLVLSRLHPVKNLPGLITAFARLAADPAFGDWNLAIHGPDADGHRAQLVAAIAAANMGHRIILGDPVPEAGKAALFAGADLFILPSFSENFGIVVAEALAHGVPVIASTGTPWHDLPRVGAGWHIPSDPDSLAGTLATAMAMPAAARAEMGARGQAFARAQFGWDGIADQMLGFYDWLLSGRAAGRSPAPFVDTGS